MPFDIDSDSKDYRTTQEYLDWRAAREAHNEFLRGIFTGYEPPAPPPEPERE